jgi:hypothetical protein
LTRVSVIATQAQNCECSSSLNDCQELGLMAGNAMHVHCAACGWILLLAAEASGCTGMYRNASRCKCDPPAHASLVKLFKAAALAP